MIHKPGCPSPTLCNCYPTGGKEIMRETIWDHGDTVLSHQKLNGQHRLVLCSTPPQQVGEWVNCNVWAKVGNYRASWDKGVDGGKQVG